jgi:DNA-binding transcriptional regulator YiaG
MNHIELKAFRNHLKMSQQQFSTLIGTTTVTICRWESGKVKPCRLFMREILHIKEVYGFDIRNIKEDEIT